MKRNLTILSLSFFIITLIGCATRQQMIFRAVKNKTHSAVTPARISFPPVRNWYGQRLNDVNQRLSEGNVDLLLIGNSIVHGWENVGKNYWDQYYKSRNAVNIGFGWDWTQHLLWRLDNTNFENISPKLGIVLIGTNNSNGDDNSAEEIADGIIAVCQRLRVYLPKMKILLLAIFPRSHKPSTQRKKNSEASLLASKIADGKMIHFLDLSDHFLSDDEILSQEIMPDYLHPNEEGYRIWAEAMEPKVAELLNERKQ